jgi:hypothetical protein
LHFFFDNYLVARENNPICSVIYNDDMCPLGAEPWKCKVDYVVVSGAEKDEMEIWDIREGLPGSGFQTVFFLSPGAVRGGSLAPFPPYDLVWYGGTADGKSYTFDQTMQLCSF